MDKVKVVYDDGSVETLTVPSDEWIKEMREFSDKMLNEHFPNLDEILEGPG